MAMSSLDLGPRSNSSPNDELKTQFMTREGTYKLMTLSEYSRPNRVGYANGQGSAGVSVPVKVSFASLPASSQSVTAQEQEISGSKLERIAFNFGREIFVYPYRGVRKAADLNKPIDKRVYKGTCPTCHDFSEQGDCALLVVGFSGGQIQMVDPDRKDSSKLFNEERHIDKTRATCIKWIPSSTTHFIVSYASGNLYVYDHELLCCPGTPNYQIYKQGPGFAVYTCKIKGNRNPLYKWTVGKGCLNEFAFSPCGTYLATVSQDGYLRIFIYDTFELIGAARSYFGGLLCVCWSPDSKYLVFGGEDDLVSVYSFEEKRVVVRGQGHKSWVSVVAFDQYNIAYGELPDGLDFSGSDDENPSNNGVLNHQHPQLHHSNQVGSCQIEDVKRKDTSTSPSAFATNVTCYRFGSVGQDTLICLWDMTADVLKQSSAIYSKSCSLVDGSTPSSQMFSSSCKSKGNNQNHTSSNLSNSNSLTSKDSGILDGGSTSSSHTVGSLSQRLASLNFGDRNKDKKNFSLHSRSSSGSGNVAEFSSSNTSLNCDEMIDLGSAQCPRINEVPMIEPLVMKKIAHERLTSLVFREECLVTACQDGYVCTWARPGKFSPPITNTVVGCTNSTRSSQSYGSSAESGQGTGTIV